MPVDNSAGGLLAELRREVDRSLLRARNGIKHAAGVDQAAVGLSPKDVIWERDRAQLWRYRGRKVTKAPPVLIVMSLVSRSYILDLRPGNSFIELLLGAGLDVFMVDWGAATAADSQNRLETYVDRYLPEAMEAACQEAGADDVTMIGYCLGGLLALLYATRTDPRLRSLVLMATPVDFDHMGLLAGLVRDGRINAKEMTGPDGNIPPDAIKAAFRLRRPTADVVRYVNLWENLWSDEYVDSYQAMNRWANDHVPLAGAAAAQLIDLAVRKNRLKAGSFRLGRRTASLRSVTCPLLNVMAERDDIVPLGAAEPILGLVGSELREELRLPAGHVAMVAGQRAMSQNVPQIVDWISRRSEPVGRARR